MLKGEKRQKLKDKQKRAPKGSTSQNCKYLQANKGQSQMSAKKLRLFRKSKSNTLAFLF